MTETELLAKIGSLTMELESANKFNSDVSRECQEEVRSLLAQANQVSKAVGLDGGAFNDLPKMEQLPKVLDAITALKAERDAARAEVEAMRAASKPEPPKSYDGYWNSPTQSHGCWHIQGDQIEYIWENGERTPNNLMAFDEIKKGIDAGEFVPNTWPVPPEPKAKPEPEKSYDGYWNYPDQNPECWHVHGNQVDSVWKDGQRTSNYSMSFKQIKKLIDAGEIVPNTWPIPPEPKANPVTSKYDGWWQSQFMGIYHIEGETVTRHFKGVTYDESPFQEWEKEIIDAGRWTRIEGPAAEVKP